MSTNVVSREPSREESNENLTTHVNGQVVAKTSVDVDDVIQTRTADENDIYTMSVGVGRDTTSAATAKQQETRNDTVDGCNYIGDIYEEKKHGKGILSWSDGRMYTGAFYADRRHGFGTFQTPEISEFKGLYRHDERFGPGILFYQSSKSADVGLWLSEDLIRLLYPHPQLHLDLHITDKKSHIQSSLLIPSWYSPQELLSTRTDLGFILKTKTTPLFCKSIQDEQSFLTRYLIDHSNGVQKAMYERCAQLDAYVTCFNDEEMLKDKLNGDRTVDIIPPNETHEQRQIYNYINKFWPMKKRATFPIDDIFSNSRSAFPNPGPLETASLSLFELSFHGESKAVRDLLMRRRAYVDVCDSRGLTALHLATYNVHINVVNILLDFGANVNQLSDDGLTSLTIGCLLYYGNDPQLTINTAFEYTDPVLLNPKVTQVLETARSQSKDRTVQASRTTSIPTRSFISRTSVVNEDKLPSYSIELPKINNLERKNPYGYELSDSLRERISNEPFRTSIHSLIKLLLRRGADPTLSDWPVPVLALAIRAGDKEMVELFLKKKAQVNCRLNAARHAHLTPLHIACGCLASTAVDIVRLLLDHGAQVNTESLANGKEYLSLADPLVLEANKPDETEQHGRTPLHIVCAREETADTVELVRLLLKHGANPNVVCNGQTPLSLAIAMGNELLVELLLDQETTDPATLLGLGNGNALCTILSINYETRWVYSKRLQLIERLIAKNHQVLYPVRFGPKNTLGSSVDYAYYSFFADARIAQTPYHALTINERATYSERKELLSYIAKRFREEVSKHENFLRLPTPALIDGPSQTPSSGFVNVTRVTSRARSVLTEKSPDYNLRATGEFHYCAVCGRSIGVRLTPCKRCQKVCFCSKPCKVAGWNTFHRYECQTPNLTSPSERPITTTKTMSSKNQFPSIRPDTKQTELTRIQSVGTDGTRLENFTAMDGALFKQNILAMKTPQNVHSKNRLPNLSVAKMIRQQRLKKMGKFGGNLQPGLPASLEGSHLSWNHIYNAPENYSFN